jgi:DNA polymerase-3 subunit delta
LKRNDSSYDDLLLELRSKSLRPVYLFHGEEDFLSDEATEAVIHAALAEGERAFNLDIVYGSNADAREIISHASSYPVRAEHRVVVVRELERLPENELLAGYIQNPLSSTCLILVSAKPDFRKKPYVTARQNGMVVECKPMYESNIPAWIARRVRQQGKEIDPEACRVLLAYTGSSLREIQNEIDKLFVFVGEKTAISSDDIVSVVGRSKEFNVFELQRALGARNAGDATEIMERMLNAGESPTVIIIMLTRYFTLLWKLTELRKKGMTGKELASRLRINPYFLTEYTDAVGRYTVAEIERSFDLLASADERLKSTSTDPKLVMQLLILGLAGQEELALL